MRELFTSYEFFIGIGVLMIVFILNEVYPTLSARAMYGVAVVLAIITWLSYRGFI